MYPAKGLMFWAERGGSGKVERSSMDGTGRQSLVERRSVRGPVGITIDYQEDKVYWVDEYFALIYKMDLDGGKNFYKN